MAKKKKPKSMKQTSKGYEKFMQGKEHNGATQKDFEKNLLKALGK